MRGIRRIGRLQLQDSSLAEEVFLYKGLMESGRYTMPDTVKGAVLCCVATVIALSAGGGR